MNEFRGLLLSVMFLLALQSILPASMVQLGDKELFQQAESVVVARVEKVVSSWDTEHRNIYSDVTVFVEYQLKGASLQRYRTFRVPGGRVGDIIQEVSEMPSFAPGERALLFLGDNTQPVIGGLQGKAQLVGNRIVGREMTIEEFAAKMAETQSIRQSAPLPAGQTAQLTPFEFEQCPMPKDKIQDRVQSIHTNRITSSTSTIFTDGFESGFPTGQWTRSSGSNGYTWGTEAYNPYAGSYAMWCAGASLYGQPDLNPATNNYANSMNAWMRWGPFDLSDAVSAQMTFYLWLESESGYDYFKWGSSIDGNAFAMTKTSGQTSGWMQLTLDLSGRVGQSQVWIAFNFTSSISNTFKGAFVDEIVISKTLPNASSPVIYNITPG
ncbi:MAG: immune inhibitor A, partial [candidate division KSB1 bacterium]|nr:immune inhibitor A [candidate division KSB1 bacterium]